MYHSPLKSLKIYSGDLRIKNNSSMWLFESDLIPPNSSALSLAVLPLKLCAPTSPKMCFWYHVKLFCLTNSYFHFRFIHTGVTLWYLTTSLILGSITQNSDGLCWSPTRQGAYLFLYLLPVSSTWLSCGVKKCSWMNECMRCLFQEKEKSKEKVFNLTNLRKVSENFLELEYMSLHSSVSVWGYLL